MNKTLRDCLDRIAKNKDQKVGPCEHCSLREDRGPALIECAEDYPQVMVVSESPAGKPHETKDLEEWKRIVLKSCYDKSTGDLSSARDMGDFLGRLTRGRVCGGTADIRSHTLYWTHTVKCFLQNKDRGIRETKRVRRADFAWAIRQCSRYLREEVEAANPRLIVGVGTSVAGRKLGELGLSNLCVAYHPGAQKSKEQKVAKLKILRMKAEELQLRAILPGCFS